MAVDFPRVRGFGENVRLFISRLRFFFLSQVEISSHKLISLFRPGSVHSGSASWDDCDQVFPDELRVSSFPDRFTLCQKQINKIQKTVVVEQADCLYPWYPLSSDIWASLVSDVGQCWLIFCLCFVISLPAYPVCLRLTPLFARLINWSLQPPTRVQKLTINFPQNPRQRGMSQHNLLWVSKQIQTSADG